MQPFPTLTLFRNKPAFTDPLNISLDSSLRNVPVCSLSPLPIFWLRPCVVPDEGLLLLASWLAGLKFATRMCSFVHSLTITDPSDISMRILKSISCLSHAYAETLIPLPPAISSDLEFLQMEISCSFLASSAWSMLMTVTHTEQTLSSHRNSPQEESA